VVSLVWAVLAGGMGGLGCAGSTGSGAHGAQSSADLASNPEALIQMRREGCATDRCAVYSLSIFSDGTVAYDGRANVAVIGQRQGRISAERLSELISAIETMHFLDLPSSGCVCSANTGRQMVTVDYRPGSVQKTVVHDSGCWSAPPAMAALEQAIDRATEAHRWVASEQAPEAKMAADGLPAGGRIR
jgi:hypothetical protein